MVQMLFKADGASLILRLMLASIFITQGWLKITQFEWGTTWFRQSLEAIPAGVQAAVAWGELICGILLVLGLFTRLAALGLIAVMVGAIYKVTWRLDFTSLA